MSTTLPKTVHAGHLTAKQSFTAYCDLHGIRIKHEHSRAYHHHLHVYAPSGQRFSGFDVDNLSLWDSDKAAPDWARCLGDLKGAMPLGTDPDYEP